MWQLCGVVTCQFLASAVPHNSCFFDLELLWGCRGQVSHSAPWTHWKWKWTNGPGKWPCSQWISDGSWWINTLPTSFLRKTWGFILQGHSKYPRGMELQLPIPVTSSVKGPWIGIPSFPVSICLPLFSCSLESLPKINDLVSDSGFGENPD